MYVGYYIDPSLKVVFGEANWRQRTQEAPLMTKKVLGLQTPDSTPTLLRHRTSFLSLSHIFYILMNIYIHFKGVVS